MRDYAGLAARIAARARERDERLGSLAASNHMLARELKDAARERKVEVNRREEIREVISTIRISGFFPTPSPVIKLMLEKAKVESGMEVLEPEAGAGHIAVELRKLGCRLTLIERNHGLCEVLRKQGFAPICADFLELNTDKGFDRILMNPPFEHLQDVDHVVHAHKFLAVNGVQVAIMGAGVFFRKDRKSVAFRKWLDGRGEYEKLPSGIFKVSDRPTGVETYMVTLFKEDEVN